MPYPYNLIKKDDFMMKHKYMILALLPILFQSALYCAEIDQMIMPQLQSAQQIMGNNTTLALKPILGALNSYGQIGISQADAAVDQMKGLKAALAQCEKEEYKTTWDTISWAFGVKPKKVVKEIKPAINNVNGALKILGANLNYLGYRDSASTAFAAAATETTAASLWDSKIRISIVN